MEDKPRSIRERPGFDEALLEAAQRILSGGLEDPPGRIAAETKLRTLHRRAVQQAEGAEQELRQCLTDLSQDKRPELAREVRFLTLEQRLLTVDDLPLEHVPALLDETQQFLAVEMMNERHLRLASAVVHAVNRLDVEKREAYFQAFGQLFAKSSDRQLASYGRRVADTETSPNDELIGQALELAGPTALGVELNWPGYRGKVVLVDFWATWCGPCRRETPLIKGLYEKYRERGLEVVGVNLDKNADALARYLEEQAIPWNNLVGQDAQTAAERYGVRGIPTLMLVDRGGKIVAVSHRSTDLLAQLDELISSK
jgi:thiol-disulfide isomerase/thioredoxin